MQITRRTAVIAGTAGAVAVAGLLIAGPAFARGGHGGSEFSLQGNSSTSGSLQSLGSVDSTTAGARGQGDGDFGHGRRGPGMMGDRGMMGGRTIHSSGVAAQTDAAGKTTYVKVSSQSGKVVSATDAKIVVKSDDGVEWSWTIDSTTKLYRNGSSVKGSAFAAGDVVEVSGNGTGDGSTATFILAGGMMGGHGPGDDDGDFGGMMGGSGSTGGTLAPVPSSSANSTSA